MAEITVLYWMILKAVDEEKWEVDLGEDGKRLMGIELKDVVKMQCNGLVGMGIWMWLSGCMRIGLKVVMKLQWIWLPGMGIWMWLNGCMRIEPKDVVNMQWMKLLGEGIWI